MKIHTRDVGKRTSTITAKNTYSWWVFIAFANQFSTFEFLLRSKNVLTEVTKQFMHGLMLLRDVGGLVRPQQLSLVSFTYFSHGTVYGHLRRFVFTLIAPL